MFVIPDDSVEGLCEGPLGLLGGLRYHALLENSVSDPDPIHFCLPNPDPGSKKYAKITRNLLKNKPKSHKNYNFQKLNYTYV